MLRRLCPVLLLFAAAALPQPADIRWKPPAGETALQPKSACAPLRELTGYEFSVISATEETAGGVGFCRVLGQVLPEVRFEVALPLHWNRRLLMIGNGGYAGEDLEAGGRAALRNHALRLGFLFTQTNTGHDARNEPLGTFAINSQKLVDYAFRAVHVTAVTAKKIAAHYYGAEPHRSYFLGCSTGGRQALIAAQRFPRDFDGISAGAPVLDFTGTMLKYVSMWQALKAAPIPTSKLKLLTDRIYAHCDARDGLQDGLIDDPRRCGFEPARHLPRCSAADAADCFTDGQIRALENIYGDVRINGERVFPGWAPGAEIAGSDGRSGWHNWIVRDDGPSIGTVFSETFFRFLAFPRKDPKLDLSQVDLERDWPRLKDIRQMLDATGTDLSAFRDRGGKLLMWYGWADPALNPMMGVEYYEAVTKKMGASTEAFFRLFMMPGVFHCSGGVGCASFDRLGPVIDWVERGAAPESLPAARVEQGKTLRTRPLCPYPRVARYNGSGNIDDAANFTCAAPQ